MAIERGGVYSYQPVLPPRPGQSAARLVVTVNELNDPEQTTCVGLLVDELDRGGLLTVRLGDQGLVNAIRIERLLPKRIGGLLYTASEAEMAAVDAALRTAYGL